MTFAVFLLAYTLSQFFRSFLAVIAPELAAELALGPQALGNMQAWWIAGFVVAQFPVGWALDSIGPRRAVSFAMGAAVIGAVLFANASSAFELDCAMALIGIGCAPIYMGAVYIFGRVNRPEQFALLCSWLLGLGSAGNLLASSPLAWSAQTFGWRETMLGIATASVILAILVFAAIKDPPKLPRDHEGPRALAAIIDIISIRSLWPILPLIAVGYAVMLAERGLWAGPYFAEVHGLGPVERGNALFVMALAMSAGAMIYGPLDRIFNTRKWVVLPGSLITAAAFILLALAAPSLGTAIALIAVIGACGMTYGVLMAHARAFFPDRILGRGITLMNVLFIGGAGILQPISGAIVAHLTMTGSTPAAAYSAIHLLFGVLLLAASAIYLLSRDMPPQTILRL
ncbi:MAG: MFS transporter [Rhizobiales bacterium]|nr:MFS transporter [Hyphomicrobiales bacterium]